MANFDITAFACAGKQGISMDSNLITSADEAALAQQDMPTLAAAWDTLNCWRWPEWLPDPADDRSFQPDCRRSQIMRWIEDAIGLRMCFRYSGPHRNSTEEEFNDFWRGNFEGHAPSRARDRKRLEESAKARSA